MSVKEATCSCEIYSCQHLCWLSMGQSWSSLETQRLQWPQNRCDNSSRVLNNVADGKTSCHAMHIRHITWESCKDSPTSDWRKTPPRGLPVIWKDKTVTKYDSAQIINSSKYQRGVVGGSRCDCSVVTRERRWWPSNWQSPTIPRYPWLGQVMMRKTFPCHDVIMKMEKCVPVHNRKWCLTRLCQFCCDNSFTHILRSCW